MKIKIYQVDAFTDTVFSGNPAAVCPLTEWLDDSVMQNIAAENNLAETAFYVKKDNIYELRWFTPEVEVDLCGHATLAAAFVLFDQEGYEGDIIHFHSPRSGELTVQHDGEFLTMNFPADTISSTDISDDMIKAFGSKPKEAFKGKTDFMLVYENEEDIINMKPDLHLVAKPGGRGVIVTSKGDNTDFVSRFYAPNVGVNEDPVTGSAHTTLTPYWADKLNKNDLTAMQLSKRRGYLRCKLLDGRVEISGKAQLYMTGEIFF